jgi:hypothetical protein
MCFQLAVWSSGLELLAAGVGEITRAVKASFHSGKLSVDWNGQEKFSLSYVLWVGTKEFNTKKNFPVRSNPRIIFLSGN